MVRRRQGLLHSCPLLIQVLMALTGMVYESGALSLLQGQLIYPRALTVCLRARGWSCISTSKKCSTAEANLQRVRAREHRECVLGERRRETEGAVRHWCDFSWAPESIWSVLLASLQSFSCFPFNLNNFTSHIQRPHLNQPKTSSWRSSDFFPKCAPQKR